ncbi:DUF2877 domain-containing protein [Intrasporangium sp.]|uniref:oxamate carbamoyltransferase subunit AllH family protein n=1 Tax=Intrasporangium sp. TaxID=1925024 RepID=UPI0029399A80|nr:DUF2877 domain-containing protein [Intrasporangium sp.]MDV3221454.1 DUF2877 domain-containing protein [Intrasporangium sp.]
MSPLVIDEVTGPRREARVLGVFPTCVYLGMGEHDAVLAVLARDALLQPIGLRLGVSSAEVSWGVTAGDVVDVGEGRVRLARADVVAARVQRPARVRPPHHAAPVPGRVAPNSRTGGRSLGPLDGGGGRGGGRLGPLDQVSESSGLECGPRPARLWPLDRARDLAAAALARRPVAPLLRGLIGAGAGLTPSGDDAVAGVLLALRSAGALDAVDAIDREVRALSHTTTSISAALLRAAGQGYAVPEVVALVDLLAEAPEPTDYHDPAVGPGSSTTAPYARPSWQSIGPTLERVLAIGHSSGRDLVAGLRGARDALAGRALAGRALADRALADHVSTHATIQEGVLHG